MAHMKKGISSQSLLGLSLVVLLVSGLKSGIGPFLTIYLKSNLAWDASKIGIALGIMNFAALLNLVPSGLLIDQYRIKRSMLAISCLIIAVSSVLISHYSEFVNILILQFFIGV